MTLHLSLPRLRHVALASALLLAGLAQAAGIQLTTGSVAGGFAAQAGANGQVHNSSAGLVDASGLGFVLATGSLTEATSLSGSGQTTTLDRLWSASASLDTSDAAQAQFQIGAAGVVLLGGNGNFSGGQDSASLVLDAELAITSTGEAVGTAVRLQVNGTADSLTNTTGPALDVLPTFDLVVRDAQGSILASWQGLASGSSANFSFSLDSRVGDSLWFSLSHASTSLLGGASAIGAAGDSVDASALLTGSLQVTAVPEPASVALCLAGLALLGLRQVRRRKPGLGLRPAALVPAALLVLLGGISGPAAAAGEYIRPGVSFALIGDTPYGVAEEPKFERVIAEINASRNVRFVLHTGDVKQGSERCDDAVLVKRFNQYQQFDDAFIITPGDNDWTDCHRSNNGGYLPTERLAKFREIYYPQPGRSTGKRPATLRSQASMPGFQAYVENTVWQFAGTTMGAVHVVGSNNNLAPWNQLDASDTYATPRADRIAEFQAREAAALAWIDVIFDQAVANQSAGVVVAMQANPAFELASTHQERQGFNAVLARLAERSKTFGKPVLLAHGDSHYFRLDKPLVLAVAGGGSAALDNFTRVENFGSPSVHWVEVFVDARDPNVFSVVPHTVPGNVFAR